MEDENKQNASEQEVKHEKYNPTKNIEPYQFKKGQSGNPGGRPKGKSLKRWVQEKLSEMDDEERIKFLTKVDSEIIWKMGEGNPKESFAIVDEDDPYGNLTDEQLESEITRRQNVTQGMGQKTGQEKPDIPNGGNLELSEDGKDTRASGTVPEQNKQEQQEGNSFASKESSKDNDGNNSVDDSGNNK